MVDSNQIFCGLVVLAVVIKFWRASPIEDPRRLLASAGLALALAIALEYVLERTSPIDVLMLRQSVDVYSVLLMGLGYGMLLLACVRVARSKRNRPAFDASDPDV